MYIVLYYIQGKEDRAVAFNTKKEAKQSMLAFIDSAKDLLLGNLYDLQGHISKGFMEYRHPILGTARSVKLLKYK